MKNKAVKSIGSATMTREKAFDTVASVEIHTWMRKRRFRNRLRWLLIGFVLPEPTPPAIEIQVRGVQLGLIGFQG